MKGEKGTKGKTKMIDNKTHVPERGAFFWHTFHLYKVLSEMIVDNGQMQGGTHKYMRRFPSKVKNPKK